MTGIPPSIMWSDLVSEIQIFSSKHVIVSQVSLDRDMESGKSKWKTVRKRLEEKNLEATFESISTDVDVDSLEAPRPRGWGRVRKEYVGRQRVIVNDILDIDKNNIEGNERTNKALKSKSFFNVVREASAVEKKKKERPTLLKFLEKFDSVDIPESVTPNVQPGFSHFECDKDNEDDDTKLLRNGLIRTTGVCRELATPKVIISCEGENQNNSTQ